MWINLKQLLDLFSFSSRELKKTNKSRCQQLLAGVLLSRKDRINYVKGVFMLTEGAECKDVCL